MWRELGRLHAERVTLTPDDVTRVVTRLVPSEARPCLVGQYYSERQWHDSDNLKNMFVIRIEVRIQ
jgi:hypothetical protein